MFPTFRREQVFLPAHFHRRWLTEVSWLRLLPQLVSSLPRPKSESGSFQLGVAASGFRLVAFTPWDNLNSTHLWTRDKGKKLKVPCTFHVQKSVFLQRVRGRVFQAESAHLIHRVFHTIWKPLQMFLMKGFYKQLCDRFSRYLGLARASFAALFLSGDPEYSTPNCGPLSLSHALTWVR